MFRVAVFSVFALLGGLVTPPQIAAGAPYDEEALVDVVMLAQDDAWAVGSPNLIGHWDGATWTRIDDGLTRFHSLEAVGAIASDDVWAVGNIRRADGSGPLVLHFDGTTWSKAAIPYIGDGASLSDVVVWPDGDVAAVGGRLMLRYDGRTWERVPVPHRISLTAAVPRGLERLWATGLLHTELDHPGAFQWDGSRWTSYLLPEPSHDVAPNDVVVRGPDRVWVVGTRWDDAGSDWLDGIYMVRWTGDRWVDESRDVTGELMAVDTSPAGALWAVGELRPRSGTAYRTLVMRRAAGVWARVVPAPVKGWDRLNGVDMRTGADAWAVGFREGGPGLMPYTLHWNGVRWRVVPFPIA